MVELSVVAQGPLTQDTAAVLASLRKAFPMAELVLSTWQGSDTGGLTADKVVLSEDPGSLAGGFNINRQLVSTANGIAAASGSIVIKTRTDLFLEDGRVLQHWLPFAEQGPTERMAARIGVPHVYSRCPSLRYPVVFHPSDICLIGVREDLLALFERPLLTDAELYFPGVASFFAQPFQPLELRFNAEQYVWAPLVLGHGQYGAYSRYNLLSHYLTHRLFARDLVVFNADEHFAIRSQRFCRDISFRGDPALFYYEKWLAGARAWRDVAEVPGLGELLANRELNDPVLARELADQLRHAGYDFEASAADGIVIGQAVQRTAVSGGNAFSGFDAWLPRHAVRQLYSQWERLTVARTASTAAVLLDCAEEGPILASLSALMSAQWPFPGSIFLVGDGLADHPRLHDLRQQLATRGVACHFVASADLRQLLTEELVVLPSLAPVLFLRAGQVVADDAWRRLAETFQLLPEAGAVDLGRCHLSAGSLKATPGLAPMAMWITAPMLQGAQQSQPQRPFGLDGMAVRVEALRKLVWPLKVSGWQWAHVALSNLLALSPVYALSGDLVIEPPTLVTPLATASVVEAEQVVAWWCDQVFAELPAVPRCAIAAEAVCATLAVWLERGLALSEASVKRAQDLLLALASHGVGGVVETH